MFLTTENMDILETVIEGYHDMTPAQRAIEREAFRLECKQFKGKASKASNNAIIANNARISNEWWAERNYKLPE